MSVNTFIKTTLVSLLCCFSILSNGQQYTLASPSGNNVVNIAMDKNVTYEVIHNGKTVLLPSPISMSINGKSLSEKLRVRSKKMTSVNEIIRPIVKVKRAEVIDNYNQLSISLKNGFGLIFRAYDDGVAYRILTNEKKEVTVENENIAYNFPKDHKASFPIADGFFTHYERNYTTQKISQLGKDNMSCLPLLIHREDNIKIAITESDLYNYPGFYLKSDKANQLSAVFPRYPKTYTQPDDRDVRPAERENYLSKSTGSRAFPWRLMVISDKDGDLINSELVYKLASPLKLKKTDWIKPGKVAWDWYNANNIKGVDFESGINTNTYKFYIDFASKYGLQYIILDEGWYDIKTNDLLNPVKDIDLEELLRYGKEKNVDIILWVTWKALEDQFEPALAKFSEWGVKGIKVDFMQRDDQWMVEYYEKVAKRAADYELLVDFHGSYKPSGLRRAYPNVISREGVKGLEQHKWEGEYANPDYDTEIPFIRMLAGPMDYTPGAMRNAQKANYYPFFERPMSLGTRCHQLAMYIVYESPLQMLADSPSEYLQEEECMKFLSAVPTVWDETKVLDAQFGEYINIARKNGKEWYVGVLNNWTARDVEIDFSFLGEGSYKISLYRDGDNAERNATDYKLVDKTITSNDKIKVHLASGGGWVARVSKN